MGWLDEIRKAFPLHGTNLSYADQERLLAIAEAAQKLVDEYGTSPDWATRIAPEWRELLAALEDRKGE